MALALGVGLVLAGLPGLLAEPDSRLEGQPAAGSEAHQEKEWERPGRRASGGAGSTGPPSVLRGISGKSRVAGQAGLATPQPGPLAAPTAGPEEWANHDARPAPFPFDPRDLRTLSDLIAANELGESSSATDRDNGDGVLDPLEVGMQRWRGGRLVALLTGEDRYGSFDYGLRVLPPSIGDLDALEELDLNTNRLAALPDAIGSLRSLRTLRLHRNGLAALPETIGSLRSLRELVVGENALRALPPALAGLLELEELHANDNPLAELPEAIGQLPRLRVLNVSHAAGGAAERLALLPLALGTRSSLETLHLAGNRLFCSGGVPDPALAPAQLRDGAIPRLHGLLDQHCAP